MNSGRTRLKRILIPVLILVSVLHLGLYRSVSMAGLRLQASCLSWNTVFMEDFFNLQGWATDSSGGTIFVSGGILTLQSSGTYPTTYPIVWRNDLFNNLASTFALEVRVAWVGRTAYGTTVAAGTEGYGGQRYNAGDPYPINHFENVLMIHGYDQSSYARVLLNPGVSLPLDGNFHTVRNVFSPGRIDLYVDGTHRATYSWSGVSPRSFYIGNPFTMPWGGTWTTTRVDYVMIQVCTSTPTPTPTRTPTSTPTPTRTPTSTPTIADVVLSARYPRLVWHAPRLGQPAQVLDVVVEGGAMPYQATFYISPPEQGLQSWTYLAQSSRFSYGPLESGDAEFGVGLKGLWRARVAVNGVWSNEVSWEVSWFPVHVTR